MKLVQNIKKIRGIKSEVHTLSRAYMDIRTPVGTKLTIAVLSLIYIINPFDILPDVIPLLGILDDTMIIPLIMWILIPNTVLNDARVFVAQEESVKHKKTHWFLWGGILSFLIVCMLVIYYWK